MRRFMMLGLLVGPLLFSATTASAITLYMSAPSSTVLGIGETFTVQLRVDTEGETHITSIFASVQVSNASIIDFVGGTSPGTILFNFST